MTLPSASCTVAMSLPPTSFTACNSVAPTASSWASLSLKQSRPSSAAKPERCGPWMAGLASCSNS
jgi:hypothetical protein